MGETKTCEHCTQSFERPSWSAQKQWENRRFCSGACVYASRRIGKFIPCRICGAPTKYHGHAGSSLAVIVRCENPACIEASRLLKNERIAAKAAEMYATGERARIRTTWNKVSRVSPEELVLTPWFIARGWLPQYRFNTDVHSYHLPRQFILDFALVDQCLYVEIDGSVHRLRKERDKRKNDMMAERGWRGLRIPAKEVRATPEEVQARILSWWDGVTTS